jgi:hypothetical protein
VSNFGLEPGSNARVYRDGGPGDGVHEAVVGVPQDRPLELRNLNPGTYCVVDELGNREDFEVSAFAESAWLPVRGVDMRSWASITMADQPAVVDEDTVRVPGAPGSGHVQEPDGEVVQEPEVQELPAKAEKPAQASAPAKRKGAAKAQAKAASGEKQAKSTARAKTRKR